MAKYILAAASAAVLCGLLAVPCGAGIVVYEEGDKMIEVGGRIQLQYLNISGDEESRDQLFFRRLRPYISGTVTKDWMGKIQLDFGKSLDAEEVAIKDAYMMYSGWTNKNLYIGNTKTPFSREFLTSSKRQQLVERTFVGDHNFGNPDRQLGFRLDGKNESGKIAYKFAIGAEHHDPAVGRIDFDTPVNTATDWNEGMVYSARFDYMPMGAMKYDQADFRSDDFKVGFGVGAFGWANDDDVNTHTSDTGEALSSSKADLDSAQGIAVSLSVRGRGFSADADYQVISADTVVNGFTGGIYRNGTTDLTQTAIEGGYMFPQNFELVAGHDTQDADNYETSWDRTAFGVNYYLNKHKVKVQFTYRMGENVGGVKGVDLDSTFLQFQFVF